MSDDRTTIEHTARGDERAEMLIHAGLALSSELSLDAVLQRIVDLAVEVTGAGYGALAVLDTEGGIVEFITHGVTDEQRARIGSPPTGHGVLGRLVREGRPLRIPDLTADQSAVGFPPHHPAMHSFLGAPVTSRSEVYGNIYLTEKRDAPEFTDEDERNLVILAAQAGVAVENARLYQEARTRERWLEAVREIATAILSGAGSEVALELVARRARELVGADLATITAPEGTDTLVIKVAEGAHAEELRGRTFPLKGSISGEAIGTGRPIFLQDASSDERAYQPVVQVGEMGPAMFVPLSIQGRPFGTLLVCNRRGGRTFGPEDQHVVESFADQAAVALEYARAQRDVQRLAILEDRERIAKELHDGVIQSLFAVGMGLQGTGAVSKDPEIEERIGGTVEEIDRVIRDLRNYIFGLRPGILADRQLNQALRHLADDFQEKSGVLTIVEVDEEVASELTARAADLIQLTREALSNVGRHAEAATCRVSLRRDGDGAALEIDDDGKGFDPTVGRDGGQGLANLRARADALGGEASIRSVAGEGTTVRIRVPL